MILHRVSRLVGLTLLVGSQWAHAQQAHVNLDWNPQKNTQNLLPFGASVISPEVHDDQTVTFRLKAPDAKQVMLTGGPVLLALNQKEAIPFKKDNDSLWTLTVGPIKSDIYVYKFMVDGVSVVDPNNTLTGFNDQPGYSNLVVHGAGPAYYDAKPVPHGAVTRHVYHSNVLNGEREMYIYTPPGYSPKKKYPVLYLVGGSGELASGWSLDGRANFIADNLLAEGKMVPMIIAMPNNQVLHRNDPNHLEKTYSLFDEELTKQVIPFVDKTYNTVANRKGRALAGLSMGGRHTQMVGLKNLDLFSSFGILSAGDLETEKVSAAFLNDLAANQKVDYLLVGLGTNEANAYIGKRAVALHEALQKHSIKHEYYVGGDGAHDWATWRHLLYYKLLPNLWQKK